MANPAPVSLSFQLPDLLAQTNAFTFRTNKHTRRATDASESWLLRDTSSSPSLGDPPLLTDLEKSLLPGAKYGLLAGLSVPACDSPQLQLITDLISLVLISHGRLLQTQNGGSSHTWLLDEGQNPVDGLNLLDTHTLFSRSISLLSPPSKQDTLVQRLNLSILAFAKVQTRVQSNLTHPDILPSLTEYIALRREIFASSLFWDMVEVLEVVSRPKGRSIQEARKIHRVTQCAVDVVAWAIDMFAYASPTRCASHNLISLLSKHKSLSVQGAMNYAGGMVRETLQEFHQLERQLTPSAFKSNSDRGGSDTPWSWIWSLPAAIGLKDCQGSSTSRPYLSGVEQPNPMPPAADGWVLQDPTFPEEFSDASKGGYNEAQVARYVLALRDYIIGSIHWGYETELYFGQKGDEIRSFGWVFLNSG